MYRVSNTVRSTHNQDGAIVLDVRQGQMFNVNFVGSRILELLKNGSTESAITDQISREFGVGRELAESDARQFIQALKNVNSSKSGKRVWPRDLEPRSWNRPRQPDRRGLQERQC